MDASTDIESNLNNQMATIETLTDTEVSPNNQINNRRTKKIIIAVVLLGFIAFVIADSLTNQYTKQAIDVFLQWIQENPTPGVFAFMGVYFIATGRLISKQSSYFEQYAKIFRLFLSIIYSRIYSYSW